MTIVMLTSKRCTLLLLIFLFPAMYKCRHCIVSKRLSIRQFLNKKTHLLLPILFIGRLDSFDFRTTVMDPEFLSIIISNLVSVPCSLIIVYIDLATYNSRSLKTTLSLHPLNFCKVRNFRGLDLPPSLSAPACTY